MSGGFSNVQLCLSAIHHEFVANGRAVDSSLRGPANPLQRLRMDSPVQLSTLVTNFQTIGFRRFVDAPNASKPMIMSR